MKEKLGIIGHFGAGKAFYDGQTIKTLTLRDGLEKFCGEDFELICADTYYVKHNIIKFLWQLICCLLQCDSMIVLLSKKGRKILFPILYLSTTLLKKKIYHCAIGGRLADEAENTKVKKYISSFKANWVETKELEHRLKAMGVKNAEYMPNFKNIKPIDAEKIKKIESPPFRFCTFSRVMREKGISDAIEAICAVNRIRGNIAELDIYGQIEPSYEKEFNTLIEKHSGTVNYCGIVPPEESVSVLSEYYMLLFPTHWSREGIPGTIIDALASGLPVIARQWRYCDEMLVHGVTGYCYPFDAPEKLSECIERAIEEESSVRNMRSNCLARAEKYKPEVCIADISDKIKKTTGENL